jgi:pyruvate-ferredoxin/flavodoxin oxidoreductase
MAQTASVQYPGISAVVDGSEAIAHIEVRISEAACAYPITPSTTMAAQFQAAVANGRIILWGTPLAFVELESEHSSASSAEGFALAGGRAVNFTAGQGLILMKEVLYVIAGKRLPVVFHVGARALTSQGLNIHAGHDDVMGVADTGWGILFARTAQEAADLTAIARRAAEAAEVPFLVAQDGFLTTHTLENVLLPEDELLRTFVGDPRERIRNYFDPAEALMTGVVQNQDSYMKGRIGQRAFYEALPVALSDAMAEWERLTGRRCAMVDPCRTHDAQQVVVSMGTIADSTAAVVDHLRQQGRRVGAVAVTAFRPFPAAELVDAIGSAEAVAVIERTDEPAAHDNPLTREVKAALADRAADGMRIPRVVSASAGLGSRDVLAGDILAVFDLLANNDELRRRRHVVLGIRHPMALERKALELRPAGAFSLRGHSIGGFGSVTTNRLVASLVGELFGLRVQAYPRYGSEKKGLPTTFYLTIADERIRMHGELESVDMVAAYDVAAFRQARPLQGLVGGGTLFIETGLTDPEAIWQALPADTRADVLARSIQVWALDTATLAKSHAPRADLEVRMRGVALAGVFLRVSPFASRAGMRRDEVLAAVGERLERFFGKRGRAVVDANLAVVTAAYDGVLNVTESIGMRFKPMVVTASSLEAVS